jgi:hypothetical protein
MLPFLENPQINATGWELVFRIRKSKQEVFKKTLGYAEE